MKVTKNVSVILLLALTSACSNPQKATSETNQSTTELVERKNPKVQKEESVKPLKKTAKELLEIEKKLTPIAVSDLKKHIIGTWEIDVDVYWEEMQATLDPSMATESIKKQFTGGMSGTTITINEDGTAKWDIKGSIDIGKWTLTDKELNIDFENTSLDLKHDIIIKEGILRLGEVRYNRS